LPRRGLLATTPTHRTYQNMRSFTQHSNTRLPYAARLMPVRANPRLPSRTRDLQRCLLIKLKCQLAKNYSFA
jgi:hypothetical protein